MNMLDNVRVQNVSNLEHIRNTKITNVRGNTFSKQDDYRFFSLKGKGQVKDISSEKDIL